MRSLASLVVILMISCLPSFSTASDIADPDRDRGKHLGQQHGQGGKKDPVTVPDLAATLPLLGIGLAGIGVARLWLSRRK